MMNVEITAKKNATSTNIPIDNAPRMISGMNAPVDSQVILSQVVVFLRRLILTTTKLITPIINQSMSNNPGSGHNVAPPIWVCIVNVNNAPETDTIAARNERNRASRSTQFRRP